MKKLAFLLLIALPVCCLAETYTVDDDGPADYNTIWAAVIDANDGDRIIVYPGTYFEQVNIKGKAVTLRSTDPNDPNIVATTIIDGNGLSRCIGCSSFNGPNAVISGFTLQNGNAPCGAGLQLINSSPAITNCTFINNSAGDIGGAIRCIGNATIKNCTFIENSADDGGAMYCAECNPTIVDCDFIENTSIYSGGAIYCSEADPNVSRCNFNGNLSHNGGGIGCFYGSSSIITDCNFFANEAHNGWGGGLDCDGGSNPTLTNCIFTGNSALYGGGGFCSFEGSNSIITNCIFTSNSASLHGGGAYLYYQSNHTIENCDFTENSADFGGAICCDDVSATIAQCSFAKNSAASKDGGAVYCREGSLAVVNCTFSGNSAYGGGGMSCITSSAKITNSTFTGNSASQHGGGISCWSNHGLTLTNCILWANTASNGNEIALKSDSTMHLNYCDIEGGRSAIYDDGTSTVNWGLGNFDVNPCFVDPGYWDPNGTPGDANDDFWVDGDYHLKSEGWRWDITRQRWDWDDVTSRCIDAGNPGSPLYNEPLSIPADPNNEWGHNLRINMGAYGRTAKASIPPYDWALLSDVTNDGTTNFADFTHLADMFMQTDDELFADFNRNGKVDLHDLALFIADWLHITTWH